MSTVAASKTSDVKQSKPSQYDVGRPGGKCSVCGEDLSPGAKVMAALRETPQGFERLDVSPGCWPKFDRKEVIAFLADRYPSARSEEKIVRR